MPKSQRAGTSWAASALKRLSTRPDLPKRSADGVGSETEVRCRLACRIHLRDKPGTAYASAEEMEKLVDQRWMLFLDRIDEPPTVRG